MTHQLETIDPSTSLHVLIYVPFIHPPRYHRKPMFFQIHTEQR